MKKKSLLISVRMIQLIAVLFHTNGCSLSGYLAQRDIGQMGMIVLLRLPDTVF